MGAQEKQQRSNREAREKQERSKKEAREKQERSKREATEKQERSKREREKHNRRRDPSPIWGLKGVKPLGVKGGVTPWVKRGVTPCFFLSITYNYRQMLFGKINMFYTKTTQQNVPPISRPKNQLHPKVIELMNKNAPNEYMMFNNKRYAFPKFVNEKTKYSNNLNLVNNTKTMEIKSPTMFSSHPPIPIVEQNKYINLLSMNFSQLNTGKPCGSCGGR